MKKKIVILFALAAIVIAGGVTACKHGRSPCCFDEFDLSATTNRIASRLDLTESQKADLEQKAQEIANKAKSMHVDYEDRHQKLAELVRQDSIDKEVADRLIAERLEKMKTMADFISERLIAFHGTLTPEQREKVATRIEERASSGCRFGFR